MVITRRSGIIFLSVMSLLLCSFLVQAEDIKVQHPELERSSIVVLTQPSFKFTGNTQFSWVEKNHADISGAFKKSGLPVQTLLDEGIHQAIKDKGYRFSSEGKDSLLIQYHVSLESEMDDMALAIHYGLAPGLNANSEASRKYERGTLVVDLIDPVLMKVVWRGAIGVFTGLEKTDEGRKNRVSKLLKELFANLPAA
ncbi:hypothetical protein MNBD_GAMMA10-1039 [hydrothermal vent metagenome]|uniref:DUF4136 domain-containing protein n=1 Tax=hydrothermal vent metagenome TaxID=652676 RepID=A0A3B0XYG0_9ZZZZ